MQAADSKFEDVIDRLDQVISLLERIAEAVERSETDISAIQLELTELGTNVHSIKVDAEALPDIRHEVGMIEINTR
jgi:hypothetical protein